MVMSSMQGTKERDVIESRDPLKAEWSRGPLCGCDNEAEICLRRTSQPYTDQGKVVQKRNT